MRRVVVQVTVSIHETVNLDVWCSRIRNNIKAACLGIKADADSVAAVVLRTYEETPKLINRTKHLRKRQRNDVVPVDNQLELPFNATKRIFPK